MPSPFPGMDPYLEHPELWPALHHWLIIEIARLLSPQLRPKYLVSVEVRMYETADDNLSNGIPDVNVIQPRTTTELITSNVAVAAPPTQPLTVNIPMPYQVREGYLEIRERENQELITLIEILSPSNKRSGKGRQMYEEKREEILGSRTHLIEIDLLRRGRKMPIIGNNVESHYSVLVCRGNRRPRADLYAFNVQDPMPAFPLPLRSGDTEPIINLQELFTEIYDVGSYDLKIDYRNWEVIPALSETDTIWANDLLRDRGFRD
ncbi:MAG: DUF4058 family protein [Richelia sp. CSU_2_1]|nr:DUF4058 family protein [Microcoleus sp. SU_5_6]NJL66747.1 DUF4058 family protein [Microcoleus sp. SM1_3_4]NJR22170.1 DUF4058 family protein [Richelia sp. CSU_2_1]